MSVPDFDPDMIDAVRQMILRKGPPPHGWWGPIIGDAGWCREESARVRLYEWASGEKRPTQTP